MKEKNQMKGFQIAVVIGLLLFFGSLTGIAQDLGDVNNSGVTDIVDALLTAQYYVGLNPAGFVSSVADVNCSGEIDIVDALLIAQYYVGLVPELSCGEITPGPTAVSTPETGTSAPTSPPGVVYTGNSTWFTNLGMPYGGCGITQAALDTPHFVALNVQDSPGDYTTFLKRPISSEYESKIGMFNNGLNCGRWVRVTIGDYCNGTNDGAINQEFCRGGSGWIADKYNGAVLDMIIADSCHDGNAWCRDDPYHLDLAKASLNQFVKDGQPVGDMDPDHYNNRQIHWQFIEAPDYTGDIRIGLIEGAQIWWPAIAVTHLKNGIHGVDYYDGDAWVKAEMNADMGQSFIIEPTEEAGREYRIRVYDIYDQLINDGRIYNFSFPESCGTQCTGQFNEVSYTTE
ncbi:MAG: hypothetical protein JXJ04_14845 [Spirochaetales bacterium]|nr:hypothetical protein [Spirochaetales bacterium]